MKNLGITQPGFLFGQGVIPGKALSLAFSAFRVYGIFRRPRKGTGESCANHELSSNREQDIASASRIPAFPIFFRAGFASGICARYAKRK